jgi:hypothetical protein
MSTKNPKLGYHYFPDTRHYTARDLKSWLPILRDYGASWLTLRGLASHAIPETFIQGLIESEIQPILHVPAKVGDLKVRELYPLLTSYARWGIRHVVVYDRPNIRPRWKGNSWSHRRLVDRFLDNLIPILKLQRELGMHPVFPPLEPGGDYWDTAFLQSSLVSLARRGEDTLLDDLVLTAYSWTYDHSLSWGAGGPDQWPESRPYHTPEESQDQLGFRIFDWYGAIASKILGDQLPILIIAGGPTNNEGDLTATPQACIEQVRGMMRIIMREDLPKAVRAFCFYPFVLGDQHLHKDQAWYTEDRKAGMIAEAACEILDLPPQPSEVEAKSIQHYLLLPEDMDPSQLETVSSYLMENKATAGFSLEEARSAEHVTIMLSNASSNEAIEAALSHSGCRIDWLKAVEASRAVQQSNSSDPNLIDAVVNSTQGADHG